MTNPFNTDASGIDTKRFPNTAAFLAWYNQEKTKGLLDIKFFTAPTQDSTLESFCGEANRLIAAKKIPHPELF